MKKLIIKIVIYSLMILISLEIIVRVFHLSKDDPSRFVDEYGVEKWIPNQEGYSVTGNRNQNFSKFHINKSGFNSYREFTPSKDKTEIALVGDSYIQGFHQNYNNSIGKKIENRLENVEVYEYGYAGYDLADQLHLINKYKKDFDLIDHVFIGLQFKTDLTRGEYKIIQDRMHLESPIYNNIRKIKLLVYTKNIGVLDPLSKLVGKLSLIGKKNSAPPQKARPKEDIDTINLAYIENFKSLIGKYGFNKERFVFLLDSSITPNIFLGFLDENNFKYLDFHEAFNESTKPTTLIYDRHWNNHGRDIMANLISNYYKR